MGEYIQDSIERWDKKLTDIINGNLEDTNFKIGNSSNLLILDTIKSIVIKLSKEQLNLNEVNINLKLDLQNQNNPVLEIYFDDEKSPRIIISSFYSTYKIFNDYYYGKEHWAEKLKNQDVEFESICENIINIERLLKFPKIFRSFIDTKKITNLKTSSLLKRKTIYINNKNTYNEAVRLYETRIAHYEKLESIIKEISIILDGNSYMEI